MAAVGDDCYFYCTSTCAKGASCPFRHVESAKTNKVICQHWKTTGCYRPMCKFRHSDFHIQVNYSEIPCYWEGQPVGCSKANCSYKHSKPRPNASNSAAKPPSPDQQNAVPGTDGSETKEVKETPVNAFVMPIVKPIIIDPESEASNSSPVKKPPPRETTEIKTEESKEKTQEDTKSSSPNAEHVETTKGKKKVVAGTKAGNVVGKKKKAAVAGGVLKQKNGKLGKATAVKGVKKVTKKKAALNGSDPASVNTTKVPVKRKKVDEGKTSATMAKKQVKDRLGVVTKKKEELSSEEGSSSDSDDSIENVKVLSMEEIFRQKALESMMKKRAAEGKPMLPPDYNNSRNKSTVVRPPPARPKPIPVDNRPKKPVMKKKASMPPQESEEEEQEEEEVEEKEVESASGESESSSSESSESEEDEVRRVVINLDAEKTAREKAKASLAKKRHVEKTATAGGKVGIKKRKVMGLSRSFTAGTSSITQPVLSVKQRLGVKPPTDVAIVRRKLSASSSSSESEEEESEILPSIRIKSLDELQQAKSNRLGHSPIKDRLGPSKSSDEEEERSGRQILITEDPSDSVTPKKARKRPWSTAAIKPTNPLSAISVVPPSPPDSPSRDIQEDQRTVSTTSPTVVAKGTEFDESINDAEEPESPFESLRRRALLKKTQQLEDNVTLEIKDEGSEDGREAEEEEEGGSSKRKKHKHKHKHKKHKKSKSERQIYVPPAKKSVISEVLERVKKVPSLLTEYEVIADYEDDSKSTESVSAPAAVPAARSKPRAAAMWAAGLSVSSKGLGGRSHLKMNAEKQRGGDDNDEGVSAPTSPPHKPAFKNSKLSTSSSQLSGSSSSLGVPVVKTFSQIMAEKRQKRQQQQGQEFDNPASSNTLSSSSSSSPSRMASQKPDQVKQRAPITPIRFDLDNGSKVNPPTRGIKPANNTTSILNRRGPSNSPPPPPISSSLFSSRNNPVSAGTKRRISPSSINQESISSSPIASSKSSTVSLSEIRPTYKTARAKKLFNKKASSAKTQEMDNNSPPPSSSSIMVDEAQSAPSSFTQHHHHNHKSTPTTIIPPASLVPSGDSGTGTTLKSHAADGKRTRRASTGPGSHPRRSTSMEDDFSLLDEGGAGEDIEDISHIVDQDVEPIDDLLQDIDDLLA